MPSSKKKIIDLSRELRKNQTSSEKKLWNYLRERQFLGLKFLRQKPIKYGNYGDKNTYFIADFYCAEEKLIVEVDGEIHNYQKGYDNFRDEVLIELGYKVFRIKK
jgi:very-short-patch-repair endonuclease